MSRTVFLSAGESSGDLHGAALARELLRLDPGLRLLGLGGERMAGEGVRLLEDLDRLAVMGFAEVVRSLPFFVRLRRRVVRTLRDEEVDLVIPIDYPGFNLSLAERARSEGIRVLYFIAPQVWAWREGRARRLADACDLVCVVLPFERELLAKHGANVRFVGHPLLDGPESGAGVDRGSAAAGSRAAGPAGGGPPDEGTTGPATGAAEGSAQGDGPVLALFPGSRAQEVDRILPAFVEAARGILRDTPGSTAIVGRAPELEKELFAPAAGFRHLPPGIASDRATAALTKSGTVTLELALAGVPMVVGYRMHPLSWWIARRLVAVDHIALVNLVAGERLVPELLQDDMTPERLREAVRPFLREHHPERERVRRGLARVRERLGEPGCSARVAAHAMALLEGRPA